MLIKFSVCKRDQFQNLEFKSIKFCIINKAKIYNFFKSKQKLTLKI